MITAAKFYREGAESAKKIWDFMLDGKNLCDLRVWFVLVKYFLRGLAFKR
jgi:hypothetical protein